MTRFLIFFFIYFSFNSLFAKDVFFISTDGVRVRSADNESAKVLGLLNINDQVKKVNSDSSLISKFSQIEILVTNSEIIKSEKYFVATEFLKDLPIDYKKFSSGYFVVINIASEILRLYERICSDNYCFNKMRLETETVAGEDKNNPMDAPGKGRSIVGSYRLSSWIKFYEDGAGHYPAWYNEEYPSVPPPGKKLPSLWFAKKYMPTKNGIMRGAFGWYTALLTPAPYGQWVHGTMGWGEDKDFYIRYTKTLLPNIIIDPRSSGCIRNNNEAIAYLRQFLPAGTPIIKIYAEERIYDPTSPMYKEKMASWNYVLTKNKDQKADKYEVIKALNTTEPELDAYWRAKRHGTNIVLDPEDPLASVLEVGTYTFDIHPDASKFVPGERLSRLGRKINRNGNIYGIKSKDMSGVFFVDTGLLIDYAHPRAVLQVSGYLDEVTPPWMKK